VKIDARRIDTFLSDPGAVQVVLLHGEDAGLIDERADLLVRGRAGSLTDPFRVSELTKDRWSSLREEANQSSLMGGARVVRIRDATDVLAEHLRTALLHHLDALIVIQAGVLPAASKLRKLLDDAPQAGSIACYAEEGRGLEATIRTVLQTHQMRATADVVTWLAASLGANRLATRRELEKLALYAGIGSDITLDMAMASVGDVAGLSVEDALDAAFLGNRAQADRAVALAIAEGLAGVGLLRMTSQYLQRLLSARLAMDEESLTADAAMHQIRPPVFVRRVAVMTRILARWRSAELVRAIALTQAAERLCKSNGMPGETVARNVLLRFARKGTTARIRS
jgi:DNA polymerase-3 subunit delta